MPAARGILPPGLENIASSDAEILCRICTDYSTRIRNGRDVIILRTSKNSHLASATHKAANELMRQQQHTSSVAPRQDQDAIIPLPVQLPIQPVHLRPTIQERLDELQEEQQANKSRFDLFEDASFNEHEIIMNGQALQFSAGDRIELQHETTRHSFNKQMDSFATFEHVLCGEFSEALPELDDNVEDSNATGIEAALQALGMEEESDNELEENIRNSHSVQESEDWAPHGSKAMFMLDLLDNLPRLRLSDDHLRVIIWAMRECGAPAVPSFSALRKMQASMTRELHIGPDHHTSALGNHFYMNHPAKLIAMDWANPLVRQHIQIYPEIGMDSVSEFWQAEKWVKELDLDELSPMWADWERSSHRHYYVKELAQLSDQRFVIPMKWINVKGKMHVEVYIAVYNQEFTWLHMTKSQMFSIADPELERIDAQLLSRNVLDLKASGYHIKFSETSPSWMPAGLPNPLRLKARGRPMFRLRVMPWSDDVSGNVSKQYNPHTNVYVQNLNIPHKNLAQEYFVRFCSTSSHASSSEQFTALHDDFNNDVWHEAYDCKLEQDILFQISPHVLPADNPQQSEDASHIGVKGQRNCRHDGIGGSDADKETDIGYTALFHPGTSRKIEETVETIKSQVRLACTGNKEAVQQSVTQSGVKDKISQFWIEKLLAKAQDEQKKRIAAPNTRDPRLNDKSLKGDERKAIKSQIIQVIQCELWDWIVTQPAEAYSQLHPNDSSRRDLRPGDHFNILLRTSGIDPHADTPVEILHTWLLGNEKYLWHDTNKVWDKKKEEIFAVRLQSSSIDGLSMPPPRAQYLVQYKNSLIGKHFKVLQQLGIFHIHGICSDTIFELWKASGELGAMLWIPEIYDMKSYLDDLQILVNNVLDLWALLDPSRIITKVKLHVLTHIVDDVRRFGPAILYSTEVFECWNAVFRICSVLSNHLAPSQDIAVTLADMERFKHQVSGGWWKNSVGDYVRAGKMVRNFLVSNSQLQRRLGWVDTSNICAGTFKLKSRVKRHPILWRDMMLPISSLNAAVPTNIQTHDGTWDHCKYFVARMHDICKERSWVFFDHNKEITAGRILKIVAKTGYASGTKGACRVIIEKFNISNTRDARLNMPLLLHTNDILIVQPEDVIFLFNAQHDCVGMSCTITDAVEYVQQERITTDIRKQTIKHTKDNRYIVNMHALHNAHLLRDTLPRSLICPIPYLPDRQKTHHELAKGLRTSGPAKRAETQEKARNTRERNKKAAERCKTGAQFAEKAHMAHSEQASTAVEGEGEDDMDEHCFIEFDDDDMAIDN